MSPDIRPDIRTTYAYDTKGNLTQQVQDAGDATHLNATTTYTYTATGQPLTITDPMGKVTRYAYNTAGEQVSVTEDAGRLNITRQYGYDAAGNRVAETDPLGHTTISTYDAARRLVETRAPAPYAGLTRYGYDAAGHVALVQRQAAYGEENLWQARRSKYTRTGQPWTQTDSSGSTTTYAYDALDRQVSATDPEGRVTATTYDSLGRVATVTTGAGSAAARTITNAYTPNGNLASVTDSRGNTITYTYDGFDRLTRTTSPDASFEASTYDAAGRTTTKTRRNGTVIAYTYDALDRMLTKATTGEATISYTYDLAGHMLTASTPIVVGNPSSGPWSFVYDTAGRLTSEATPDGRTTTYTLDAKGNRTGLTTPDGTIITATFDALNRITSVTAAGTTTTFAYDALDRRTSLSVGVATQSYSYNGISDDLTTLTQSFGTQGWAIQYGLNRAHQLTSESWHNWPANAPGEHMAYPAAPSNTAYGAANTLNQYPTVDTSAFTYDAAGNLTNDGTTAYTYDTEGHLLSATNSQHATTYTYDPMGRRASKTVDGVTTRFIYAGRDLIAEMTSSGSPLRTYIRAPDGEHIGTLNAQAGSYAAIFHDRLGSVIAAADPVAGTLLQQYAYGPYGSPALPITGTVMGYAGYQFDTETGLYHVDHRTYSPALGRWMQPDPIGTGDDWNMYQYVHGDPMDGTDPSGLASHPDLTVDHTVPSDAVLETAPDGQTFLAPSRANWTAVYNAGEIGGLNPVAMNNAVGQFGTFDFQRCGCKFLTAYSDASNFAVGVYMAGTGLSFERTKLIGKTYGFLFSSNSGSNNWVMWWSNGWRAGSEIGSLKF